MPSKPAKGKKMKPVKLPKAIKGWIEKSELDDYGAVLTIYTERGNADMNFDDEWQEVSVLIS